MKVEKKGRTLFIALGWLSLAAAFVGVLLPIVPQVPFAILAAFFFSKGSPRLHHWLLNHNQFGPSLRDWEMDHVIRWRAKIASSAMMVGGAVIGFLKFREESPVGAVALVAVFAVAILFVLSRRSQSRLPDDSRDSMRLPVSSIRL